jgi:hypothetical protein
LYSFVCASCRHQPRTTQRERFSQNFCSRRSQRSRVFPPFVAPVIALSPATSVGSGDWVGAVCAPWSNHLPPLCCTFARPTREGLAAPVRAAFSHLHACCARLSHLVLADAPLFRARARCAARRAHMHAVPSHLFPSLCTVVCRDRPVPPGRAAAAFFCVRSVLSKLVVRVASPLLLACENTLLRIPCALVYLIPVATVCGATHLTHLCTFPRQI